MSWTCANCGTANLDEAEFCTRCHTARNSIAPVAAGVHGTPHGSLGAPGGAGSPAPIAPAAAAPPNSAANPTLPVAAAAPPLGDAGSAPADPAADAPSLPAVVEPAAAQDPPAL